MLEQYLPSFRNELTCYSRHQLPVGIDEAGRGPWAGPVVAAAVVLPHDEEILKQLQAAGVTDSKALSAKQRERLRLKIVQHADCFALGTASPAEIDRYNILRATKLAALRAIDVLNLSQRPTPYLLTDALNFGADDLALLNELDGPHQHFDLSHQQAFVRGELESLSIAAASILAKVTRDQLMQDYDREYPGYGFARHKGYGTREHQLALKKLGPCPIHRLSYKPVKKV